LKSSIIFLIFSIIFFIHPNILLAETKIGIGSEFMSFISIGQNSGSISKSAFTVPILIDNKIMIEPGINYVNANYNDDGFESKSTSLGISIGLFRFLATNKVVNPYYGGIISWSNYKYNSKQANSTATSETNTDTISLIPTLGVEIRPVSNLSVASELGLTYMKSSELELISTTSRIIVRVIY